MPSSRRLLTTSLLSVLLLAHAMRTDAAAIDADPLTPRQQAIVERVDALASAHAKSSSLRLRILYSVRIGDDAPYLEEVVSAADLYEQARGSTDPVALDLLLARCSWRTRTAARCDRLSLARRWTEADTQNQLAWLALAAVLTEDGRRAEAREAFVRAARAPQWREYEDDVARDVAAAIPHDLSPEERRLALMTALTQGGYATVLSQAQIVNQSCKDAALREACLHLVDTMARDGTTLVTVSLAGRLSEQLAADPDTIRRRLERRDAIYWGLMRSFDVVQPDGALDAPVLPGELRMIEDRIRLGEVATGERWLANNAVRWPDAARQYADYVAGMQRAFAAARPTTP